MSPFCFLAVSSRLNTGHLRIIPGACPNLLREATLYRWSETETDSEEPVDEHNHALAALRYLIYRLDEHKLARQMRELKVEEAVVSLPTKRERKWLSLKNEALWRPAW